MQDQSITKTDDVFTLSERIASIIRQLPIEDARQMYIYASALQDRSLAARAANES